jgi:hypothetical protein
MGTSNSDLITNIVASPTVANDVGVDGGRVRVKMGTISLGTGDIDAADIIRLARFKIKDRIFAIYLLWDVLDAGGNTLAMSIGLYQTNGTLIDVDSYASAIVGFNAAVTTVMTNQAFEARNINAIEQRIWEDAGLTSVPSYGEVDLCLTVTAAAATAQAGDLTFIIHYTED